MNRLPKPILTLLAASLFFCVMFMMQMPPTRIEMLTLLVAFIFFCISLPYTFAEPVGEGER